MPLDFLSPRVERLAADGRVTVVHPGGALGRLRSPVLLLARDLCAFDLFPSAALPARRRRQAARLHARVAAPYVAADSVLVRAQGDYGVWWWDAQRVAELLGVARSRQTLIRPETLAQPKGEGWRVVKLESGYEAQLWRGKALLASAWRKDRFAAPLWTAFARRQRGVEDAPELPPAPSSLPLALDSEAFRPAPPELTREQTAAVAGGGAIFVAAFIALFQLGQGYQLSRDSEAVEAEVAGIRTATPATDALQTVDLNQKKMAAYREVESRTNPLSAAGAAIAILALHDLTPSAVNAEVDTLTFTLPYAALEQADALVADLEDSGYFYDLAPRTDGSGQAFVMEMKVRASAAPLSGEPAPTSPAA